MAGDGVKRVIHKSKSKLTKKTEPTPEDKKIRLIPNILIDPGHGDHNDQNHQIDPGCVNGKDYEKDIALNISNSITTALQAKGYVVTQTRSGDVGHAGKKLKWRLDRGPNANILVSIHVNALPGNAATKGFSVCYCSSNPKNKNLAESILHSNTIFTSKGVVDRDGLYLLKAFKGASALVEAGFISNASDLNILKSKPQAIGQEIANGIIKFIESK